MSLLLAAFLVFSWSLAGCSSKSQNTQVSDSSWALQLQRSGGFAGVRQTLSLNSNGEYTITDERKKVVLTGQLEPDRLKTIRRLLEQASDAAPVAHPAFPGRCADCFEYRLTLGRNGKRGRTLHSHALDQSPYGPLVGNLDRLILDTLGRR